jgi:hypothetical protein
VEKEVVMQQYPRKPVETSWMKRNRNTYVMMDRFIRAIINASVKLLETRIKENVSFTVFGQR